MTTEEAIRVLIAVERYPTSISGKDEACEMAISALHTQKDSCPPLCYKPDGDGCAYQTYDGDDEPIDKCKECPLCNADKVRHKTEPLTPEELREMDGQPIWVVPASPNSGYDPSWAILYDGSVRVKSNSWPGAFYVLYDATYATNWLAYRCPPNYKYSKNA